MDLGIYEKRHNDKFPNNLIKVVEKIEDFIYFETKFGMCKKHRTTFGKNDFGIMSALNKTEYLKKQLKSIYGDKFDYSLVEYKNNVYDNIFLICTKHNTVFTKKIFAATSVSANCPVCIKEDELGRPRTITTQEFIERSNNIHNFKYDYSKVTYIKGYKKVKIICPFHGEFEQLAGVHLMGSGCNDCGCEKTGKINSNNPTGWTLTNWKKKAENSKYFDSYKCYIIKCWNNEEEFYKIGRTFSSITWRFRNKNTMPYNYEVLEIYINAPEIIFKMENQLKKENKQHKYIPKIKFNGMHECFLKLNKLKQ